MITDPEQICEVHQDVGYDGVIYPVVDWSNCDWTVQGNVLNFQIPEGSKRNPPSSPVYQAARNGSLCIEEIYIGELYTSVIATTTERIEFWFSNELENNPWLGEQKTR